MSVCLWVSRRGQKRAAEPLELGTQIESFVVGPVFLNPPASTLQMGAGIINLNHICLRKHI